MRASVNGVTSSVPNAMFTAPTYDAARLTIAATQLAATRLTIAATRLAATRLASSANDAQRDHLERPQLARHDVVAQRQGHDRDRRVGFFQQVDGGDR